MIAKIIGVNTATLASQTIYDPTCGSASLLLKAHDEAQVDISIYGQEMDNATAALAKMNMILHGCSTADIVRGNTLSNPAFLDKHGQLKTFDFAVANPPFSTKAWRNGFLPEEDSFNRFAYGIPPDKNGDYAFLLHILSSLNSTGKGAVILPHGVLFRGNAEADIRKTMITQGYIKGIICLLTCFMAQAFLLVLLSWIKKTPLLAKAFLWSMPAKALPKTATKTVYVIKTFIK